MGFSKQEFDAENEELVDVEDEDRRMMTILTMISDDVDQTTLLTKNR